MSKTRVKYKEAPRKNRHLYQLYLWVVELDKMSTRHKNRASAIERGDSLMSMAVEERILRRLNLRAMTHPTNKAEREESPVAWLALAAADVSPVYDWLVSIKGIAGKLAGGLMACTDWPGPWEGNPTHLETISQYWRMAGWAVINGKAEYKSRGQKRAYKSILKNVSWQIGDQFMRQRTPTYRAIYDKKREELDEMYPEPVRAIGSNGNAIWKYTPIHKKKMAMRPMIKEFLAHVWLVWRTIEGIPVSKPYIHAIKGHTNLSPPPNFSADYTYDEDQTWEPWDEEEFIVEIGEEELVLA